MASYHELFHHLVQGDDDAAGSEVADAQPAGSAGKARPARLAAARKSVPQPGDWGAGATGDVGPRALLRGGAAAAD